MNTLTRAQGYKQNAWKGKIGEEIFEDFLSFYGIAYTKINDKKGNMEQGDYYNGVHYFEVKSQNIGNYKQNFVELGEITDKEYHSEGYSKLVKLFEKYDVNIVSKLKPIKHFNFALTPVANGAMMVYINRDTKLIYIYTAKTFLTSVAEYIKEKGIQLGLGKANKDSVSSFCMNAKVVFQKEGNKWVYKGSTDFNTVMKYIKEGK
jgi:hypothetical protein